MVAAFLAFVILGGFDDVVAVPFGNHVLLVVKLDPGFEPVDLAGVEKPLEGLEPDTHGGRGELREFGGYVVEVPHASVRREDDVEQVDEDVLVAPVAEDCLESCVGEDAAQSSSSIPPMAEMTLEDPFMSTAG